MGILKHFFSCKDITQQVKYWIYTTGPLNTLLWGSESWIISEHNCNKLWAFHHSSIRRILGIWMDEVIECNMTNKQVRRWFDNMPPVDDFIARRTWNYMGKIMRAKDEFLPRKVLGAWVPIVRKQAITIKPQRKLHPSPENSTKRWDPWWSNIQRMVSDCSRWEKMEHSSWRPLQSLLQNWWQWKWICTVRKIWTTVSEM